MKEAKAPEALKSERLCYRRPGSGDLEKILKGYAADGEVTKYLSWPTHRSPEDTLFFLDFSDAQWEKGPAGPYLIEAEGRLIGSTGLAFETAHRATTGYVFAKEAWGKGYATEALKTMIGLARQLGACRLESICHADHQASARVLEKGGFVREGLLRRHTIFPNLDTAEPCDVYMFGQVLR
jgi:ribosomal-protein-alanine N-acetyltransferase